MYTPLLYFHSYLRWIAVALLVALLARALSGWLGNRPWVLLDERLAKITIRVFEIQFLAGLLLFIFASPITRLAFRDLGAAMDDQQMRFWTVEHSVLMFLAVGAINVGWARARKAERALAKHRFLAIFVLITVVLVAVAIPWPGTPAGRPLFRFSMPG